MRKTQQLSTRSKMRCDSDSRALALDVRRDARLSHLKIASWKRKSRAPARLFHMARIDISMPTNILRWRSSLNR
ncbi:hypothetical protein [Paraburkholderia hospita]|uniref:hypothetical protein n=1 Tax=Paraburkholderia hospita TaxID=169430 RepID=UPI0003178456|nr:hypothetical protein [Paraburkholderia hospita]